MTILTKLSFPSAPPEKLTAQAVKIRWSVTTLITIGLMAVIVLGTGKAASAQPPQPGQQTFQMSPEAIQQMEILIEEKEARTPEQQKISSDLLYKLKQQRNDPILRQMPRLNSTVEVAADGTVVVDIRATVTDELLNQIKALGGTVINSFPQYNAIQARVPLDKLETLAASPAVKFIRTAIKPMLNKINTSEGDLAHRANEARSTFRVNGTGVRYRCTVE